MHTMHNMTRVCISLPSTCESSFVMFSKIEHNHRGVETCVSRLVHSSISPSSSPYKYMIL
ncbi:unnamed protein product [Periconia digitata]|uniref:Uncharacterized protein n=1 Tax=Periconia digitata TaxID=1303443 RepID=A0A9W4XJE0_9PLEO|nr:unnamed protein product [Periconia digitata]